MKIEVPLCFLRTFVPRDAGAYWDSTWWRERKRGHPGLILIFLFICWVIFTSPGLIITIAIFLKRKEPHGQMRSCILKLFVWFLGCYSNLNIISLVLLSPSLVLSKNCNSQFWEATVQGRFYFCKFFLFYLFIFAEVTRKEFFFNEKWMNLKIRISLV